MKVRLLSLGVLVFVSPSCLQAQKVDFLTGVEPILKRCRGCHGAAVQMNGLRLDSREAAVVGGYSGPVILPGKGAESRLVRVVAGRDKVIMPPSGPKLNPSEVAILQTWIDEGAGWPGSASPRGEPVKSKAHWSFEPIRNPGQREPRPSIDSYVISKLAQAGLSMSPEARRETLIRRVSLDLTGLPPDLGRVARFAKDTSPDAYERLVDELLASPHYGEKWAMHWLNQVRYADSDGYANDRFRPGAWRYRHWVINALNANMPFDQFTIEQLAGDLLPNATTKQHVAAGFYRNGLRNREGGVKLEQNRFEEAIDRTNTVGTVWLGLTAGCAQCHDHKYDPLTQKDYYRLFAFFGNLEDRQVVAPIEGELGPWLRSHPEYLRQRKQLLADYRVPELQPEWERQLLEAAAHPGRRNEWDVAYNFVALNLDNGHRILRTPSASRDEREAAGLTDLFVAEYKRVIPEKDYAELQFGELSRKLTELSVRYPDLTEAHGIRESTAPRAAHIMIRGQYDRPGVTVQPGPPSFLAGAGFSAAPTRLDLAKWIVSKDNPLTARVAVNRIWQEYFGRGLVATSDDFGMQGDRPSHPELLDWLAHQFIESGWDVKALHRLIVTSATYRQSSTARPDAASKDPTNTLLARQGRLRLPAEMLRDIALSASGLINPVVGGPSVRPPLPKGVIDAALRNTVKWEESSGKDLYRRGLYIAVQRSVIYPLFANFDAADRTAAVCRRDRSNTPLQALNLLNDPVFYEAAEALAFRIQQEAPDSGFPARLQHAYSIALSRDAMPEEIARLKLLFDEYSTTRSEAFAWRVICRILLNLDEFITRE